MTINVSPTPEELQELHDDLKAYENNLATYLLTPAAQDDPNFDELSKFDIALNVAIYNLSTQSLQLAADNAGQAIDAINSATSALDTEIKQKADIAKNLTVVQSVVTFVTALLSENPSNIIKSGVDLAGALKAAQ